VCGECGCERCQGWYGMVCDAVKVPGTCGRVGVWLVVVILSTLAYVCEASVRGCACVRLCCVVALFDCCGELRDVAANGGRCDVASGVACVDDDRR
jgi:hypothetical protein